jgi:RNA polymerase sigma-70 factor (ECF subfamily)
VAGIALFLQSQKNDYQQLLREDCGAAAKRHGMSLRAFSADHDPKRQAAQIREVLAEKKASRPDVMLVSPVREADLPDLASEAGHRQVGWVLLNRWSESLPELRRRYPMLPIFSVTADQYEIGHVQGRQFRSLLPGGGEVVYVRGRPGTSSAERRHEGVRRELEGSGIHLRTVDGDWSSEGGERAMAGWLKQKAPGRLGRVVVGAQNDSMAAGARQALTATARELRRHVGPVGYTGCDGGSSFGQRLVASGILTATVLVPPVAGRAVDEWVRMRARGVTPPPEIVLDVLSYPDLTRVTREGRGPGDRLPGELLWDETQLLAGLVAGDHLAQTVVFRQYQDAVQRVLMRILHEPQDVADALQDTFIKIFRSASHVKDPRALRVWVLRVAHSVGLDEFRRRRRLRDRGMVDIERLVLPAPGAPPEVRGALQDMYRVLSCLPDSERMVFAMRFIEGRELATIAAACELSLATVKRRLGRAESRFMSLARRHPGLSEWVTGPPARRPAR